MTTHSQQIYPQVRPPTFHPHCPCLHTKWPSYPPLPHPTPASLSPCTQSPEQVSDHLSDTVPYLTQSSELSVAPQWLGIKAELFVGPAATAAAPAHLPGSLLTPLLHHLLLCAPSCSITLGFPRGLCPLTPPCLCSCCSLCLECPLPLPPVCLETQPPLSRLSSCATSSRKPSLPCRCRLDLPFLCAPRRLLCEQTYGYFELYTESS